MTSVALIAFAPAAFGAPTVTQVDSQDPVPRGENVIYTMTVTNSGGPEEVWLSTLTTKAGSDASVPNPYISLTSSQGSCTIDPPNSHGYTGGECALGTVSTGASVQVQGVVQANYSMDHRAVLFLGCDPSGGGSCFPFFTDGERTTVTHPPTLSGSEKIRVTGLPPGCATSAFTAKAKAKAKGVRSMTATLSGPRNEFGGHVDGDSFSGRIARKAGSRLKAKVPAETLDDGFYKLTFLALRKGVPNLKTAATFQVC